MKEKVKQEWEIKWENVHACPKCQGTRWKTLNKGVAWQCHKCGEIVGTPFEKPQMKSKKVLAQEAKAEAEKNANKVEEKVDKIEVM
jgi:ribosomal protein L37AE/L43A